MNDRRIRRKTEMPEKIPTNSTMVIPKEIPNSFSLLQAGSQSDHNG